MEKKHRLKTYKQNTVNAVILAVILFIFVYMAIQFSRNFSVQVSTQRTQTVTDYSYVDLTGYIFRDEAAVSVDDGCVVNYLVRDGEKVRANSPFADVYLSTLSDGERQEIQARLNSLSDRIYLLNKGLSHSQTVSDLGAINQSLSKSYYSYINSVLCGDYRSADSIGEQMIGSLVSYSVITNGDVSKDISAQLIAERQDILLSLSQNAQTLSEDTSFNFFYESDGYERIFHTSKLTDMSPSELSQLATLRPEQLPGTTIGKKVYSPKWYVAIPANEANYLLFNEGDVYDVSFCDSDNVTFDMTLERICIDEENSNSAYLLFSCYDLSSSAIFAREQSVRILIGKCSGYRVPKESLQRIDGGDGVYILVGNVVEFRRVTVIGEGLGYYIVNSYDADSAEGNISPIPYLNVNDLIITSGTDLYDGKHLD